MTNPDEIRGPIESQYNKQRDDREKLYVQQRVALEANFHQDLRVIRHAKEDALVAAGLNPDGSVPSIENRERAI
jgi:hypothetical protein